MNKALAAVVLVALCAAGCTQYYKVTDPTSGKTYYTTDLDQNHNGSCSLKDARTGNKVTIQNSEVDKLTKEEFQAGMNAPAPMPATMPAK